MRLAVPALCVCSMGVLCSSGEGSKMAGICAWSVDKPRHWQWFQCVRQVLAKALFQTHVLTVHFSPLFYKRLLGMPLSPSAVEDTNPELSRLLCELAEADASTVGLVSWVGEGQGGAGERDELAPDSAGERVAEADKADWTRSLVVPQLSKGAAVQLAEVRKGFFAIVPPQAVEGFRAAELEWLLCDSGAIGIEDWKGHMRCPGVAGPASVCVFGWLWEVVEGVAEEEHRNVMCLATGSSQPPFGGFTNLRAKGTVRPFTLVQAQDKAADCPVAHVCFNEIGLPPVSRKEVLEQSILLALHDKSIP